MTQQHNGSAQEPSKEVVKAVAQSLKEFDTTINMVFWDCYYAVEDYVRFIIKAYEEAKE